MTPDLTVMSTIPSTHLLRIALLTDGTQVYIGWNVQFAHSVTNIDPTDFAIINSSNAQVATATDANVITSNDYRIRFLIPNAGLPRDTYKLRYVGSDIIRNDGTTTGGNPVPYEPAEHC